MGITVEDLKVLDPCAVEVGYPEDEPSIDLQAAVTAAAKVREKVRAVLEGRRAA